MNCPQWAGGDANPKYTDPGTVAHHIGAACLTENVEADSFTGMVFTELSNIGITTRVTVDQEMAAATQQYVDYVRDRSHGHTLLVEQRIDFSSVIGVPDQFGTGDAVIIADDGSWIEIVDLKFGKGVPVYAENNEQLQIYAVGKLAELEGFGATFERVIITIHQPRLDHVDSWEVEDIDGFKARLRAAAQACLQDERPYVPGKKQCQWCSKKATCPALTQKVQDDVGALFEDLTAEPVIDTGDEALARAMDAVDLIEEWCKAVRAATEKALFDGRDIPGYKLVNGKRGARAWSDEEQAEKLLREKFRLTIEQAYNLKLISPTQAEKVLKESPRRWAQLEPLITQSPGKPSVAPASDKRPAYSVAAEFEPVN